MRKPGSPFSAPPPSGGREREKDKERERREREKKVLPGRRDRSRRKGERARSPEISPKSYISATAAPQLGVLRFARLNFGLTPCLTDGLMRAKKNSGHDPMLTPPRDQRRRENPRSPMSSRRHREPSLSTPDFLHARVEAEGEEIEQLQPVMARLSSAVGGLREKVKTRLKEGQTRKAEGYVLVSWNPLEVRVCACSSFA